MITGLSAQDLRDRAGRLSYRNQALIDGKYVDAASGKTFECVSPIDGRTLTSVAECDAEDVDRAVRSSRKAFESGAWSTMARPRESGFYRDSPTSFSNTRTNWRCSKRSIWASRSATRRRWTSPGARSA